MNLRQNKIEKSQDVVFVIDESGSMASTKKQTLDGLNEQLQTIRKNKADIKTYVTLVTFNDTITVRHNRTPIEEIKDLEDTDYQPNGSTKMLDAVGQTIGLIQSAATSDENESYLLFIMTDGEENASREYSWDKVAEMMTKCKEDKRWTISYVGANQDLSVVQQRFKGAIDAGNIALYQSSAGGSAVAFSNLAHTTSNYLFAKSASVGPHSVRALYASSTGNGVGEGFADLSSVIIPTLTTDQDNTQS